MSVRKDICQVCRCSCFDYQRLLPEDIKESMLSEEVMIKKMEDQDCRWCYHEKSAHWRRDEECGRFVPLV